MSRTLAAGFLSGVAGEVVHIAYLAEFEFSGGTVRFWTGVADLVYDGDTYTGLGNLAEFGEITEGRTPEAPGMRFALNGVNATILAAVFEENYRNRPCRLYMAVMATNFATVTAATIIFSGLMSSATISDNGLTGSVSIEAENELSDLMRVNACRYTDAHQRRIFSTDTGLRYVASVANRKIYWGRDQSRLRPATLEGGAGGGVVEIARPP